MKYLQMRDLKREENSFIMLDFKQAPSDILQEYISQMYSRKPIYNNYYGISLSDVDYYKTENTLIIRKSYESFFRIYILSTDKNDLVIILRQIATASAINIPSRTGIGIWKEVLDKSGFTEIGVYSRFYNTKIRKRGKFVENFAREEEFIAIRKLLYDHFSPITDRLPLDNELINMIRNKWVLVNRNEESGEVEGVLGYILEHNKCYLQFWIDLSGFGLLLLFNVYNMMVDNNIKFALLWVKDGNKIPYSVHQSMGALPDGLKDYTFVKK